MRKLLTLFVCVFSISLVIFVTAGQSQKRIADCVAFLSCETPPPPPTGQWCEIYMEWTKCNGSRGSSANRCTNQGCISQCACA
jgi:hypothetical protein